MTTTVPLILLSFILLIFVLLSTEPVLLRSTLLVCISFLIFDVSGRIECRNSESESNIGHEADSHPEA